MDSILTDVNSIISDLESLDISAVNHFQSEQKKSARDLKKEGMKSALPPKGSKKVSGRSASKDKEGIIEDKEN